MILNPVIKKSGSGKMAEWEKLEVNSSQDVPMPLAGSVAIVSEFELNFEQLPRIILFRTIVAEYEYSALYLEDGEVVPLMTSYSNVGVVDASVNGAKITGAFGYFDREDIWFRAIYI